MKERITKIMERWFINEPALFQILCTHKIEENVRMKCPVRCGRRRVEYNPDFVSEMTDNGLEEALKTEAVRILLKHPYERRPDGCSQQAISIGSNIVIGDNYSYASFNIDHPEDYGLDKGMPYEWYSRKIQELLPDGDEPGGAGGGGDSDSDKGDVSEKLEASAEKNRDLSELWDEDDLTVSMINGIIDGCTDWGSLGGSLAETIKASTKAKINWKNVFSGFRASILSSRRKLTRMRPNRRSGFEQMGSIREFDTRVLIAVDVSGSISSDSLSYFYGVINSAFRYGITCIDVIQFDCGITTLCSLKKAVRNTVAVGRGGTSFQKPIDYAHENRYDGLVILTDGYAPVPNIPVNMRCKIIWVCQDKKCYENNHAWMEKSGRVCTIELK